MRTRPVIAVALLLAVGAGAWLLRPRAGSTDAAPDLGRKAGDEAPPGPTAALQPRAPSDALEPEESAPTPVSTRAEDGRRDVISGRVITNAGLQPPVAGALVMVSGGGLSFGPLPARCDAEGAFEVTGVLDGKDAELTVTADDFIAASVSLPAGAPRRDLVIRLGKGAVVEGTVRDLGGPVPRARVHVVAFARASAWGEWRPDQSGTTTTDDEGRFQIRGVALDVEQVVVALKSELLHGASEPFLPKQAGESFRRDVRLPDAGSIRVRFVGWSREQIGGSYLTFEAGNRVHTLRFQVGRPDEDGYLVREEDGAYLVEDVEPGPQRVSVRRHGAPDSTHVVNVVSGEQAVLEVPPTAGGVVEGIVVTEKGAPVARTFVEWQARPSAVAHGGDDGRFRFEGLLDRGTLVVHAALGPDHESLVRAVVSDVAPGDPPVRVVMRRSPTVVGRISGVAPGTRLRSTAYSRTLTGGGDVHVGDGGRFARSLGDADVPMVLAIENGAGAPITVDIPPIPPGSTHDVGELSFGPGRVLARRLVDERGLPVAGATVSTAERWAQKTTQSGADGVFRIPDMPDRPTETRIDAKGFPVHVFVLPAGSVPHALTIGAGGVLEGKVVGEDGAPVARAHLTFYPDGEHPYDVDFDVTRRSIELGETGTFSVRLQARGHRIRAYAPGWERRGEANVEIRSAATEKVEIVVR